MYPKQSRKDTFEMVSRKSKPESMMSECSGKIQRKSGCLCPAALREVVQASAKNVNRLRAVRGQLARQASRLLCTSATYYASMRARANSAHFAKGSKLLRIEKMQFMESVNLLYCLANINQCIQLEIYCMYEQQCALQCAIETGAQNWLGQKPRVGQGPCCVSDGAG